MNVLSQMNENIVMASWNFSEAGHGKGPMDGVGGVVKRTADSLVLHGENVASVEDFLEKVKALCPGILLIDILLMMSYQCVISCHRTFEQFHR